MIGVINLLSLIAQRKISLDALQTCTRVGRIRRTMNDKFAHLGGLNEYGIGYT